MYARAGASSRLPHYIFMTDDSKNPLFLLAVKSVCMCERESVPKADFFFFPPDNNNKAWCLVAGFHPNPNAFRRCFEFAAAGDLAVDLFFIFILSGFCTNFFFFFFFASRDVQKY